MVTRLGSVRPPVSSESESRQSRSGRSGVHGTVIVGVRFAAHLIGLMYRTARQHAKGPTQTHTRSRPRPFHDFGGGVNPPKLALVRLGCGSRWTGKKDFTNRM